MFVVFKPPGYSVPLKLRGGGVWVTLSSVILSKKTKKQKNKFTLSNTTLSKKFQKKN